MNFGEKIRKLRTERGWSQAELGRRIGKTQRTIVGYETGASYPRKREVYSQLAELFDVDVNYLLTENEAFMTEVGAQFGRRGQAQASAILSQTRELFAGGSLSETDEIAFLTEMQQIFLDSKKTAREKYTPKKYREHSDVSGEC